MVGPSLESSNIFKVLNDIVLFRSFLGSSLGPSGRESSLRSFVRQSPLNSWVLGSSLRSSDPFLCMPNIARRKFKAKHRSVS